MNGGAERKRVRETGQCESEVKRYQWELGGGGERKQTGGMKNGRRGVILKGGSDSVESKSRVRTDRCCVQETQQRSVLSGGKEIARD